MNPLLNIAIKAVRSAGNYIYKNHEKLNLIEINKNNKNKKNLINKINQKIKKIIFNIIKKYYPNHVLITKKEELLEINKNKIQWIVSPIDGIHNFIRSFPFFSTSIAIYVNNSTKISTIYNPVLNELFTAIKGEGAKLNNYRLRLNNNKKLKNSIITINYSLKNVKLEKNYFNIIKKLLKNFSDFRKTGSSILDFTNVVTNRTDIFFAIGLNKLKFIIGDLLIRESGGITLRINKENINNYDIIAGNIELVNEVKKRIKKFLIKV